MKFHVDGRQPIELDPVGAIIAGFTGRDQDQARAHLQELADEGVPVPDEIPSFYTVPARSLVQADTITVTHDRTSGEAEAVLLLHAGDVYVTLGSDHTDRFAETKDIALSKLACPKVLAGSAWPLSDTTDHWDDLGLRSWVTSDGHREVYQQGTLGQLLTPKDLLDELPTPIDRQDDVVVFTGTLSAEGGIRSADRFEAELADPVTGRAIRLDYRIRVLELLG